VTLAVAETVGVMAQLLEMTRRYALDRVAFGRPIGSYQALKHLLADLSVILESAQAVSAAAVRATEQRSPSCPEVASIAKIYVNERAVFFAQQCLQIFGGIGFTWEHDLHLYMRRLTASTALYGTSEHHRTQVLAAHRDEITP
jgi:alkylation response protein AidB-like acyl-CoA dehydrogenase